MGELVWPRFLALGLERGNMRGLGQAGDTSGGQRRLRGPKARTGRVGCHPAGKRFKEMKA